MKKKTEKKDISKGIEEQQRNRSQGKEIAGYIPLFKQFSVEYRRGNRN
jgi:hypothetical protein